MKRILLYVLLSLTTALIFSSCEKFLSERNTSMVTNINSLQDMQALMDAGYRINFGNYSGLIESSTDDFFLGDNGFNKLDDYNKSLYLWQPNVIYGYENEAQNWTNPFHIVAIVNTVLDELALFKGDRHEYRNSIEGTALFHRAFVYYNLVQVYCTAYNPNTAKSDLGLPIRVSSDVSVSSKRTSLEETLLFIESDIYKAIDLLPIRSEYQTRPNKAAAHALLAKLYLMMEKYSEALKHCDSSLLIYDSLLDYNEMDSSKPYPFEMNNKEVLFSAFTTSDILMPFNECYIDSLLYRSYDKGDLRKTLFFQDEKNGYFSFRGSYVGTSSGAVFNGLTVSELFLIRSEVLARLGRDEESVSALNYLLKNRYRFDEFEPVRLDDSVDLLELVLNERRKEMIFRGTRWTDLKRLNKDPRFSKTLIRQINGDSYRLPPNDNRYVFLIPETIIERAPLEQNPR